ncbi:MAG: alpha/beta hydrolase [Deltaproteobacteria bacterium]|nr:alpha/beta hydrolase [Deltaproteobacteria bacterium]
MAARNEVDMRYWLLALAVAASLTAGCRCPRGNAMNLIFPGADRHPETPRFGTPMKLSLDGGRSLYLLIDNGIDPKQAKAVVLYFHGNAELVEDLDYVLPFFRREAWVTVLVEFPGFGHHPGKPGEAAFYQAALDAYDQVTREIFPGLPVIAAGWSLGTPVATYLAAKREAAHLVLISGMTSMLEVAQGLYPMTPDLYFKDAVFDIREYWPQIREPVTLIHGDEDELVPVSMSRDMKKYWGEQARLAEVPETGHNDIYLRGAETIRRELERIAAAVNRRGPS